METQGTDFIVDKKKLLLTLCLLLLAVLLIFISKMESSDGQQLIGSIQEYFSFPHEVGHLSEDYWVGVFVIM